MIQPSTSSDSEAPTLGRASEARCAVSPSSSEATQKAVRSMVRKLDGLREVKWPRTKFSRKGPRNTVFVGDLDRKNRTIPEDFARAIEAHPESHGVLVCEERLVRPLIHFDSRISLIESPLSSDVFRTHVQAVFRPVSSEPQEVIGFGSMPPVSSQASSVEYLRRHYWAAGIRCDTKSNWSPIAKPERGRGALAVVTLEDYVPPVEVLVGLLDAESPDACALQKEIGDKTGLVYLSGDAGTWAVYWPCFDWPLWIYSRSRLPERWDLGAQLKGSGQRLFKTPSAGGDLICGLSGDLPQTQSKNASEERSSLATNALRGGFSFLEFVLRRLNEAPVELTGAFVEVR